MTKPKEPEMEKRAVVITEAEKTAQVKARKDAEEAKKQTPKLKEA